MIISLFKYKNPFIWFSIHVALGIISPFSSLPLILFFYLFSFISILYILEDEKVNPKLGFIIVYLSSFEILSRMANTSPFIPYELGKYLLMILLSFGILMKKSHNTLGIFLLILLLPALFYDYSGLVTNSDIRFNVFGAINIGLSVWYFYGQKFTPKGLKTLLILFILPLISSLTYAIIKTPDLSTIDFILGANFETTGGFGSNQVATVFGFGMLITFYLWLTKISISGNRILDLTIFILFTFQGLLSFSRGGMVGGLIGIVIILFFISKSSGNLLEKTNIREVRKYFFPSIIFLFFSAFIANYISGGNLLLRYQGETEGTISGSKEISFNTLSSSRLSILESDLDLFINYGILGVGAGASKYLREEQKGVVAHVEASRLVAEHGVLGIIFISIIFYIFFIVLKTKNKNIFKAILFSFIFIGWYTTFHSATRTYITPILIGLSLIQITNAKKNTLSRK